MSTSGSLEFALGRSIATHGAPRSPRTAPSRCQHHDPCQAPCTNRYVGVLTLPPCRSEGYVTRATKGRKRLALVATHLFAHGCRRERRRGATSRDRARTRRPMGPSSLVRDNPQTWARFSCHLAASDATRAHRPAHVIPHLRRGARDADRPGHLHGQPWGPPARTSSPASRGGSSGPALDIRRGDRSHARRHWSRRDACAGSEIRVICPTSVKFPSAAPWAPDE